MKRQLMVSIIMAMLMFTGVCFTKVANADERGVRHHRDGMRGDGMMKGMMHGERLWRSLMSLDLNEKQMTEIKEIRNRTAKETIKKRADERILGIELKELLDKDSVDMKTVEAQLKKIEALKTEMHLSIIKAIEEAKSKLTPEQRKKFKEMCEIAPDMGPPMMKDMGHGDMKMTPPQD